MAQQTKKWYKSKVLWFNVAVSMTAIGNELLPILDLMQDDEATMQLRVVLLIASSVGNTVLRIVTSTKVTL